MAPLIPQGINDPLNETQNKIQALFEDHHEDGRASANENIQFEAIIYFGSINQRSDAKTCKASYRQDYYLRCRTKWHNW